MTAFCKERHDDDDGLCLWYRTVLGSDRWMPLLHTYHDRHCQDAMNPAFVISVVFYLGPELLCVAGLQVATTSRQWTSSLQFYTLVVFPIRVCANEESIEWYLEESLWQLHFPWRPWTHWWAVKVLKLLTKEQLWKQSRHSIAAVISKQISKSNTQEWNTKIRKIIVVKLKFSIFIYIIKMRLY